MMMLITAYPKEWMTYLDLLAKDSSKWDAKIYLLIDGVFLPGLYRKFQRLSPALLFESLPGCNNETRDVSPFLIRYETNSRHFALSLAKCSGLPMVSVIQTSESQVQLATRLAAWCIVEVDGQRFNFRFPDTRRLPAIFSSLTKEQRSQMAGPAKHWAFIGRDGNWQRLSVASLVSPIADRYTILDDQQFSLLVADSEADEMLTLLQDRGYIFDSDPYLYHSIVAQALRVAQKITMTVFAKLDWCELCVANHELRSVEQDSEKFATWLAAGV